MEVKSFFFEVNGLKKGGGGGGGGDRIKRKGGEGKKRKGTKKEEKKKKGRQGKKWKWRRRNHKGKIEACQSLDLEEGSSTADDTIGDCDSGGETIGRVMRMSRSGSSLSLSNSRSHF